ncbi:MAG: lytic transglycosylase domain-containing protein [Rhizobiaceae bacterium]
MRTLTYLAAASIFSLAAAGQAAAANACESHIVTAAARYDIPPAILYAVGLTETGRKGSLYPYALNIEGRSVFPRSVTEALIEFETARGKGKTLIDLGCMQINHHYHGDQFRSPREMLDPAKNVDYAARFLKKLHGQHETWSMAVARYHAGPNNNPAQKRYICRVIANLVATGFGRWTPQARNFCTSE